MALAPSLHTKSMAVQCLSSPQSKRYLVGHLISTTLTLPRKPLSWSLIVSSRGRNLSSVIAAASSSSKRKKKEMNDVYVRKSGVFKVLRKLPKKKTRAKKKIIYISGLLLNLFQQNLSSNHVKEGDEEEDAFELLFKQLEEDLKNDDMSIDDSGDEITEEDLAMFERELVDALAGDDTELLNSVINDTETDNNAVEEEENDDDGDGKSVKLRNWQLQKLAKALKSGRRKTGIKSLAAELCLDRAVVLELLRDPPPNLIMMSLALSDEPRATVVSPETKTVEAAHEEGSINHAEPKSKTKVPVHVMQHRWSAQKRLKKAQIYTLEKVYQRTKRPTNAMISSIVYVTNLPRRRIVKWFEDKRAEDGVPDHRAPYRRSVP